MTLPNGEQGLSPNISLAYALSNDGSIPFRALLDQPTAEELLKQQVRESDGWQSAHQAAFEGLIGDPNTPLIVKIVWTVFKSITNINGAITKTIGNILNEVSLNRVQVLENVIPALDANKITSGRFAQNMIENLIDDLGALARSIEAAQEIVDLKSATGGNLMLNGNFSNSTINRFPYGPELMVDGYSILHAHSGLQSWKWSQLEGTNCGIYFAPTQTVDFIDVNAGEVYLLDCWIYPSAQNYTPTGNYRLGCTLTDSAGNYAPSYLYKTIPVADVPIGEWTRLSHKVFIPETSNYDTAKFYLYATNQTAAGSVFWVDDVILKEISAAQSALDGLDELGEDVLSAGPNIIINPSFETGKFKQLVGTYSDEQAHSGTYSLKMTANGITNKKYVLLSTDGNDRLLSTTAGDVFYGEFWIYGKSTNTQTSGGTDAIKMLFEPYNRLGVALDEQEITVAASTAIKGDWNKVSGRALMPPNTVRVKISLILTDDVNDNEVYYFDDLIVREITVAAAAEELAKLNDELSNSIIESGSNLIVNGSFENGWFTQGAGTYSDDVARTGSRSLKIISNGIGNKTYWFLSDDDRQRFIPASGGDWFYAEFFVYGKATNTQTAPGIAGIKMIFEPFDNNDELENQVITQFTSIALSNTWTRVTGKVQMPEDTTRVRISLMVTQEVTANDTYYFDDVTVKEITAAQAAEDKAELNQETVDAIVQTGYNLIVNPSFESGLFAQGAGTYSTEQFRTGSRSLKMESNGTISKKFQFLSEDNNPKFIPASPGDIFYAEIWAYGKSTNVQTAGSAGIQILFEPFNGATELDNRVIEQVTSTALNNQWTKIADNVTMPEGTTRVRISVVLSSTVPSGEVYYFDDVMVKEITEAQKALDMIGLMDGELAQAIIETGSNLIVNGDFERGLFTQGAGMFVTEQKHGGDRSLRIVANGNKKEYFLLSEDGNERFIPASPGDIFYGEFWVYGKTTNTQSAGANAGLLLSFQPFNGTTELSNEVITQVASTALNGTWTKVFNKVTMPENTTRVRISLVVSSSVNNNEVYYFDDVVVKEITAAQEAKNSADLALEYGNELVESGANFIVNPSFEKGLFAQIGSSFSTEQARTGTRSLKIVANGSLRTYTLLSDGITPKSIKANEGTIFYAEFYVYGKSTNVQPLPGVAGIQLIFKPFNGLTELDNQIISKVANTSLNGNWTRVADFVTMPTGTKTVQIQLALTSGITSSETYYFDDIFITEATSNKLLADNAVTAPKIGAAAVVSGKIDTNAVSSGNIQSNAITNPKVNADIDGSKIGAGFVAEARLADLSAGKITSGAFPNARIGLGAILNGNIGDLAINNSKVDADIDGSKIGAGSVAEARIANLSAGKITSGTFGNARIATDAIASGNIQSNAVTNPKVNADIDGSKIGAGFVAEARLADLSAGKITSGTFGNARIGLLAILRGNIGANAVNNDKLESDIDGSKIFSGTVAEARIANLSAGKITSGTFGNARIATDAIASGNIQANAVTNPKVNADIDGSKIFSGTVAEARIAQLSQSKVTNLSSDLTTVNGKASVADSFGVAASVQNNVCVDPDFSDTNIRRATGTFLGEYSTEQRQGGVGYSFKLTAQSSTPGMPLSPTRENGTTVKISVVPGLVFTFDMWVMAKAGNPGSGTLQAVIWIADPTGGPGGYQTSTVVASAAPVKGTWQRLTGNYTIPASVAGWPGGTIPFYMWPSFNVSSASSGQDIFYIDRIFVYR